MIHFYQYNDRTSRIENRYQYATVRDPKIAFLLNEKVKGSWSI